MNEIDQVLDVINNLDDLPEDHEPKVNDLWDAIRQIQRICEG